MLEDLPLLSPLNFFALSFDLFSYKLSLRKNALQEKHLLPSLSSLHGETAFAQLSMGWSVEGILVSIVQKRTTFSTFSPDIAKGDAYELFFDTRDLKTTGYNTRFCHHFYVLPEPAEEGEVQAAEITRFRGEDAHELCDSSRINVSTKRKMGYTSTEVFLPAQILYGCDSSQFKRLGFTYRLHHIDGRKQHFSCNSEELTIEDQPSFWSSFLLIEG